LIALAAFLPVSRFSTALVVVSGLVLAACDAPGLRAEGRAEATWGSRPAVSWTGICRYEVQTRWASNLPHIVVLTAEDADWSIRISGRRSPPNGRVTLSPGGEGDFQALVMSGSTVVGSVLGTLETSRRADSIRIEVRGRKVYRDTVPLQATCRMEP
jgi:hypothetical protein